MSKLSNIDQEVIGLLEAGTDVDTILDRYSEDHDDPCRRLNAYELAQLLAAKIRTDALRKRQEDFEREIDAL